MEYCIKMNSTLPLNQFISDILSICSKIIGRRDERKRKFSRRSLQSIKLLTKRVSRKVKCQLSNSKQMENIQHVGCCQIFIDQLFRKPKTEKSSKKHQKFLQNFERIRLNYIIFSNYCNILYKLLDKLENIIYNYHINIIFYMVKKYNKVNFFQSPNKIFAIVKGPFAKLVYFCLSKFSYGKGYCNPNLETIAFNCGITPTTVRKAIKKLEELNLISIEKRSRRQGNKYILHDIFDYEKKEQDINTEKKEHIWFD